MWQDNSSSSELGGTFLHPAWSPESRWGRGASPTIIGVPVPAESSMAGAGQRDPEASLSPEEHGKQQKQEERGNHRGRDTHKREGSRGSYLLCLLSPQRLPQHGPVQKGVQLCHCTPSGSTPGDTLTIHHHTRGRALALQGGSWYDLQQKKQLFLT